MFFINENLCQIKSIFLEADKMGQNDDIICFASIKIFTHYLLLKSPFIIWVNVSFLSSSVEILLFIF